MAYQLGDKSVMRMDAVASGEQSLEFGPGGGLLSGIFGIGGPKKKKKDKSFKSCNGFYKDGQCYRNRKTYRETKKLNKKKSY